MYYFLNSFIADKLSGIEHAEINRLHVFLDNKVDAKIVTRNFNRFAHHSIKLHGIKDENYLNMFDYFAGTISYSTAPITLSERFRSIHGQVRQTKDGFDIFSNNRKTMSVAMFKFSDELVDFVKYFNGDGNCTKQDFYDTRGFKSLCQYYDTADGHLVLEQFYKPSGSIFYEISYEKRDTTLAATNIQLVDLDGNTYSLMNINQAFTIMLDAINSTDGDRVSTFISDRSNVTNEPMINMKTRARKIEHFHNIHFKDYWDPMHSPLTYPSIANNELLSKTDLVITPTPQQANDMRIRLRTQVPIVAIPVGVVFNDNHNTHMVPMSERIPGKIIAVARLYWEKHLEDTIRAFAIVYKSNPRITLDIYGYGNGDDDFREEKALRKLVSTLKLDAVIHFQGYVQELGNIYDHAQLMMMSSRHEGAPLCIVEAQSHGVPVMSYDTHYGPSYLIDNHKSGEIISNGDINALALAVSGYFKNEAKMQQMSVNSYDNAKRFSERNVWSQWIKYVVNASE